jgi:predicted Zn-dependent protease
MSKIASHFIVLLFLFFGAWFLLSRFDYLKFFRVDELTKETEHNLGELILDELQKGNDELSADTVSRIVSGIKKRLCTANGIADSSITLHIIVKDEVNAIALPDRHLVVYTGMIGYCKTPEELTGVLAHEIGHIEHGHIMKRLRKEVGLSMLTMLAGGDAGAEITRETARFLTSTAFDREMESDADVAAVHLMAKAGIDPQAFADVIFRLSQERNDIPKRLEWISTHPNTADRCAEILWLRKQETVQARPVVSEASWILCKKFSRGNSVSVK